MTFIKKEVMPRKLKVGFSNGPANETHATFRDLGLWQGKMETLMFTVLEDLVTMRDLD